MAKKKKSDEDKKAASKPTTELVPAEVVSSEENPLNETNVYLNVLRGKFTDTGDEYLLQQICQKSKEMSLDDEIAASRYAKAKAMGQGNVVAMMMADRSIVALLNIKYRYEDGAKDPDEGKYKLLMRQLENSEDIISINDIPEEDRPKEPGMFLPIKSDQ